jgi:hypothetical protein
MNIQFFSFQITSFLALLLSAMTGPAAVQMKRIEYHGWNKVYRMTNGTVELLVVADVGPRILHYGFVGQRNEFHEFTPEAGKTGGKGFRSYGGHRLLVSPEVERTYYPDNYEVEARMEGNTLLLTAPVEDKAAPVTGLQKSLEVTLAATGTHVKVLHRVTNQSRQATELAPWGLSVMAPGGRAILPLPPRAPIGKDHLLPESVFAVWSYTDLADPRWRLGTKYVQLLADPKPTGRFQEQMGGIFASAGWSAYFREGRLFLKHAQPVPGAKYPDSGCNFELYTDPGFLELESLAPLATLAPGQKAEHVEDWMLFDSIMAGNDEAWIDQTILPLVEKMLAEISADKIQRR